MDFEHIEKLMAKLESSKLKKLVIKKGDFELQLEKECEVQYVSAPVNQARPALLDNSADASHKAEHSGHHHSHRKADYVKAPLVGTFYTSPSPKDPNFVEVGQTVKAGQTLCIIEAMKVMNEILAEKSGVIVKVMVEKGQPVEFGQNLFEINYA